MNSWVTIARNGSPNLETQATTLNEESGPERRQICGTKHEP